MEKGLQDRKQMLLNLVSEVKARLDGKVDSFHFPIPQFIVVGKQSVGKSRLIEAFAGEPFNFVSGTLGSRRPTALEFRNVPDLTPAKWSVFDEAKQCWQSHPIDRVMQIVGQAHESLGTNVSDQAIRVKVEGADCIDLGIVDLPGFRAYAQNAQAQELSTKIDKLVMRFMQDDNNVILCVEEAGDAAGFSTLGKCKHVDPSNRRTILVRNKLDKYYNDLTAENINRWLEGFGDLPTNLPNFALSLPHWNTPQPPKPFGAMRSDCSKLDQTTLSSKSAAAKYMPTIGFDLFRNFMEAKIQQLFADALGPMLSRLKQMEYEHTEKLETVKQESEAINEGNILHATRSAGISFAQSFNFLMEGALSSEHNRRTMEEELKAFHKHVERTGCLTAEEMNTGVDMSLDAYVNYLRDTVRLPGMDVQLNGGAQFRRLMYEVEVFTRFAGLEQKFNPVDVIQARGSGMHDVSWNNTITTLIMQNAPTRMRQKTKYVGERLKWFFTEQKMATVEFMLGIKGSPEEHMFSRLISKQATVIQRNQTMREAIFSAFDVSCETHQNSFLQMWYDFMDSMFQSPLLLLKSCSTPGLGDGFEEEIAPTFESTKERIQNERKNRGSLHHKLNAKIKEIPDDDAAAHESLEMVQEVIEQTFEGIRCVVADQMQLYSESFFLLPMLRRLEGAMANMELQEDDRKRYAARMTILIEEKKKSAALLEDVTWCISAVQTFKVTCAGPSS